MTDSNELRILIICITIIMTTYRIILFRITTPAVALSISRCVTTADPTEIPELANDKNIINASVGIYGMEYFHIHFTYPDDPLKRRMNDFTDIILSIPPPYLFPYFLDPFLPTQSQFFTTAIGLKTQYFIFVFVVIYCFQYA